MMTKTAPIHNPNLDDPAALSGRLGVVEQHLRDAADQLQQLLRLYQDVSVEVARFAGSHARLKSRFDNAFPEVWNCPHCHRKVPKPRYPDEPQLCQVCGKSGIATQNA